MLYPAAVQKYKMSYDTFITERLPNASELTFVFCIYIHVNLVFRLKQKHEYDTQTNSLTKKP